MSEVFSASLGMKRVTECIFMSKVAVMTEDSLVFQNPCQSEASKTRPELCSAVPKLVIIGPQKTGTSALRAFLSEHPSVAPNIKNNETFEEIQFFDGRHYDRGISWWEVCTALHGYKEKHTQSKKFLCESDALDKRLRERKKREKERECERERYKEEWFEFDCFFFLSISQQPLTFWFGNEVFDWSYLQGIWNNSQGIPKNSCLRSLQRTLQVGRRQFECMQFCPMPELLPSWPTRSSGHTLGSRYLKPASGLIFFTCVLTVLAKRSIAATMTNVRVDLATFLCFGNSTWRQKVKGLQTSFPFMMWSQDKQTSRPTCYISGTNVCTQATTRSIFRDGYNSTSQRMWVPEKSTKEKQK